MLIGISLILLVAKYYKLLLICLLFFLLLSGLIFIFRRKYNFGIEKRYEFDLDNISLDDIKRRLEASSEKSYSTDDNCVLYSFDKKGKNYRVLLYVTDNFNKKEYYRKRKSINKGFNKKYSVNSTDSIYNISKRNVINIAFVSGNTEALEKMLEIPADEYVNRASSMLSVAIADNKLLIPYYIGYHFASSANYYCLCTKVFELLGLEQN